MANKTTNTAPIEYTITGNGDKFKVCKYIKIDTSNNRCLNNVALNLPFIDGADVEFVGDATIGGIYPSGVFTPQVDVDNPANWFISADVCTNSIEMYPFCFEVTITNANIIGGDYSGLAITTTDQDITDDGFIINITKVCPEIGENPQCEIVEVEEIVYVNPIKPPTKTVKVFSRPVVGRPVEAVKTRSVIKKVKDNCPTGIKLS